MIVTRLILNLALAAILVFAAPAKDVRAQDVSGDPEDRLEELLERLADPDTGNWQIVEEEIYQRWSLSGSPTMDLLLRRGREALEAGDLDAAIEHFTALTDHAPDFAEGWNARATAYFQAGLYGPSIADVERTLALNPVHFGALTGLGVMMEEVGELEFALAAFRAAHAIHPHRPDIEQAIARLEAVTGGSSL